MSLLAWTLSFLRPHRARVAVITALATVEVGFGALAPWPLKTVVDNVLGGQPLPWPLAGLAQAPSARTWWRCSWPWWWPACCCSS